MCELDQYISNLTLDINTNIGEKGLKISGGQKQELELLERCTEILMY